MAFDYWTSGRASSKVPSIAYDFFLDFFLFSYATKEEFLSGGIFVSDLKRGLLFKSSFCGYSAKSLVLILEPLHNSESARCFHSQSEEATQV
jgi:hypothetical protein